MKKKIPKSSKKRLVIFGTLSVVVIFYFIFSFGYYVYKVYDLKSEQSYLNKSYNDLKLEEKELKSEIEKLSDADYIARYAREEYSYSKDGEYIIKIKDTKKEEEVEDNFGLNIDYHYFIYGGAGVIVLIILHILKKRN